MLRQFKLNDIEDIFVTDYVANGSFQSLKENVKEVESGPVIMIRLVDFNNSWQGPFKYLDLESFKFLSKSSLEKGDIIISNVGANIGTVFRAPDLDKKMTLGPNSVVLKVSMDPEIIDKDFLYYFFSSPKGQHLLQSISGGSAQPKFNKTDLRNLIIEIPDLKIQKRFSKILLSIDKKIELNQQMNKTLEDIAKKLFKSWFIDFDPVRAKAEGRPTGLSKEISDLFPDSFEDSELGEIPKGWNYRSIYEDLNVIYGAPFSSKMFNSMSKGTPVIRIRDLKKQQSDIYTEEVHPKGVLIEKGDVVVGMDGEFRPYLWSGENAWMNQRICKFAPKHDSSSTFIIENLRKQLRFIELTEVATTVIHLGKSDIDEFLILNEDRGAIEAFNKICKPIEEKIISNNFECRKLEEIRDTLLPKLISGELKISDAENLVEEAGI